MITQILAIDGLIDLTPSQIEAALAENVVKPESFHSFNGVVIAVDDVALVETLVGAMRTYGLNASADSLIARGIDFGLQATQDMLDTLGTALPETFTADRIATLKALGLQTRWASVGGQGDPPTEASIANELARYAAEQLLSGIKARCDAAYEAAAIEYRAGRFQTITSAAESAWGGE